MKRGVEMSNMSLLRLYKQKCQKLFQAGSLWPSGLSASDLGQMISASSARREFFRALPVNCAAPVPLGW